MAVATAEAMTGQGQPGAHGQHWQVMRSGRLVGSSLAGTEGQELSS